VLHTWWYAPEANAVVRFQSAYLAGAGQGRRFAGTLHGIRRPAAGDSAGDSVAAPPPSAPAAGARPSSGG